MEGPNFTIITSGGCNAKCEFCVDPMNRAADKSYLANLIKAIQDLPPKFRQVSISGGEPTQSKDLESILGLIQLSGRFDKVVLTTNGYKLKEFADSGAFVGKVNHINLSRHHYDFEVLKKIFGTKNIPDDKSIKQTIRKLNQQGIDVNLNVVYEDDKHPEEGFLPFVERMVQYAKLICATSVTFRHDHRAGVLDETKAERKVKKTHTAVANNSCPVCRTDTYIVDGMKIYMKASMLETDTPEHGPHELIYHINGTLCVDWAAEKVYNPLTNTVTRKASPKIVDVNGQEAFVVGMEVQKLPVPNMQATHRVPNMQPRIVPGRNFPGDLLDQDALDKIEKENQLRDAERQRIRELEDAVNKLQQQSDHESGAFQSSCGRSMSNCGRPDHYSTSPKKKEDKPATHFYTSCGGGGGCGR